jgi:hypothetical protein
MGSAHFLADALDRIAERIGTFLADHPLKPIIKMLDDLRAEAKWDARIEDGDLFRRLVLKRCIFGVDLSGMAVEVAKVSLWLASFVPGLSLSYLGHNLRQGDALIGVADAGVLEDLGPLFALHPRAPIPRALMKAREVAGRISAGLDRTPEEVDESRAAEAEMNEITDGLVSVFDLWCAEPFGVKGTRGWLTTGAADKVLSGEDAKGSATYVEPTELVARDLSFFHWPAEFPEVFMRDPVGLSDLETVRPGFDVVIGNPPWEELTIEELGFYTLHDPGIRGIKAESQRRKRIEDLIARYPELQHEFEQRQHALAAKRGFFGPQGGYVAQGSGDTDLYKLFCERYRSLTRTGGWLGVVLPRSAFLVDGARSFRTWLFRGSEVHGLDLILNNRSWAFPIHPQYTIALLTAKRDLPSSESQIRMSGPSDSRQEFERAASGRGVVVGQQQLGAWTSTETGSTYEVPLLQTESAVRVFDKMRGGPSFADGYYGVWSAFPVRELDETNDRKFFRHADGVAVWKGRSFDQYDPHGADPAGYAEESETLARLQRKRTSAQSAFRKRFPAEFLADQNTHPYYSARVVFRDVSRATDSRTVRACLAPPELFLTNSAPYLAFDQGSVLEQAFALGVLNSLPFDWQARRFVEIHMNFYVLSVLRFPDPKRTDIEAIAERAARLSSVDDRFASFAAATAVGVGPLEDDERGRLLAEIDALVARAYGLDDDDLEVVFSDFTASAVSPTHRDFVRKAFAHD